MKEPERIKKGSTGFGQALWEHLSFAVIIVDESGLIKDINPFGEVFFNISRPVLLGQDIEKYLLSVPSIKENIAVVRTRHSPLVVSGVELAVLGRSQNSAGLQGGLYTLYLNKLPPPNSEPNPQGANAQGLNFQYTHDQSAKIMIVVTNANKDEFHSRDQNMVSVARSVVGMAEMLAHEIRNPLAGISGAAQLLAMNVKGEDRALSTLIVDETNRVVRLLEQVEQFGRRPPPQLRAVNIHGCLEKAVNSAEIGFASHMSFIKEYDPSLPLTLADSDQLVQVFLNLIKNAAEAYKANKITQKQNNGIIHLKSYYDVSHRFRSMLLKGADIGGSKATDVGRSIEDGAARFKLLPLVVEVIDNGPGVSEDIMRDIFTPFVSGHKNGSGLGLAVVSQIIEDHGGLVQFESEPGKTVFRIILRAIDPKSESIFGPFPHSRVL